MTGHDVDGCLAPHDVSDNGHLIDAVGRLGFRQMNRKAFHSYVGALPGAPSLARRFMRDLTNERDLCGRAEVLEAAELLISEITTNAVRATGRDHGPVEALPGETVATIQLRAFLSPTDLRVEVGDNSSDQPVPGGRAPDDAEGGRGLFLVSVLADAWGCAEETLPPRDTPGKTVWFRIALRLPRPVVPPQRRDVRIGEL